MSETPLAEERLGVVRNYGLNWELSKTGWLSKETNKTYLVGKNGDQVANFWNQWGAYVLLSGNNVQYVGISRKLGNRIREHLYDHLINSWDGFHWWGFLPLEGIRDRRGFLAPQPVEQETVPVDVQGVLHDIEAILASTFPAPGQRDKTPRFGYRKDARRWEQVPINDAIAYRSALKG